MSAAGLIQQRGQSVTFSLASSGTYDEDAGAWSGASASTVAGHFWRVEGAPERYRALELIESEAPTFEFVPATEGEIPPLGASFTDEGQTYVVRDVQPIYMGGIAVRTRLIGAR